MGIYPVFNLFIKRLFLQKYHTGIAGNFLTKINVFFNPACFVSCREMDQGCSSHVSNVARFLSPIPASSGLCSLHLGVTPHTSPLTTFPPCHQVPYKLSTFQLFHFPRHIAQSFSPFYSFYVRFQTLTSSPPLPSPGGLPQDSVWPLSPSSPPTGTACPRSDPAPHSVASIASAPWHHHSFYLAQPLSK